MSEPNNENQDSQNSDQDPNLDEDIDLTLGESEEDDFDALKAKNKKLFARAKTAEKKLKQFKQTPKEPVEPPVKKDNLPPDELGEVKSTVSKLELAEKKRQFGYKHNLSPEETDIVFRYAGDKDPEESLKEPFLQSGLKAFREEKAVDKATPYPSKKGEKFGGKDWDELDEKDKKQNFPKKMDAIANRRKG
jgi:hypothetical protein